MESSNIKEKNVENIEIMNRIKTLVKIIRLIMDRLIYSSRKD